MKLHHQTGLSLIELLSASLVISVGWLAITGLLLQINSNKQALIKQQLEQNHERNVRAFEFYLNGHLPLGQTIPQQLLLEQSSSSVDCDDTIRADVEKSVENQTLAQIESHIQNILACDSAGFTG